MSMLKIVFGKTMVYGKKNITFSKNLVFLPSNIQMTRKEHKKSFKKSIKKGKCALQNEHTDNITRDTCQYYDIIKFYFVIII